MKKVYQLESFNLIHFYRDGYFIGAFQLTASHGVIEYEPTRTNMIFVNIKVDGGCTHFFCDKFIIRPNVSQEAVFEVEIDKDGVINGNNI